MRRRVVITGIGIISAIGQTKLEFWDNCLDGHVAVSAIPEEWTRFFDPKSRIWSPLPEIDFSARGLSRTELTQNDEAALLATAAALESLGDSRLEISRKDARQNTFTIDGADPVRSGVFIGTGIGGANTLLSNHSHQVLTRFKRELQSVGDGSTSAGALERALVPMQAPDRFNPFAVAMTMTNAIAARLGIKFSVTGVNQTLSFACAAGTVAIGRAYEAIRTGGIDLAIAGGSEYLYDYYGGIFRGFDVARTLARAELPPEATNRPFDRDRSGFLFSEGGAGILVVEALDRARARGAPIVAEITGYAESFDAYSMMSMATDGVEIERMIRSALADAEVRAGDVDYINAHGTGTELNDATEADLIARIFGDRVLVNSTKSLLGHTIGASGAIEAAVTALSLRDQVTHACRNLDNPIKDLNFAGSAGGQELVTALTHSFAFGGHNAGLVLSRYP